MKGVVEGTEVLDFERRFEMKEKEGCCRRRDPQKSNILENQEGVLLIEIGNYRW